jgi:hypothetical protein
MPGRITAWKMSRMRFWQKLVRLFMTSNSAGV